METKNEYVIWDEYKEFGIFEHNDTRLWWAVLTTNDINDLCRYIASHIVNWKITLPLHKRFEWFDSFVYPLILPKLWNSKLDNQEIVLKEYNKIDLKTIKSYYYGQWKIRSIIQKELLKVYWRKIDVMEDPLVYFKHWESIRVVLPYIWWNNISQEKVWQDDIPKKIYDIDIIREKLSTTLAWILSLHQIVSANIKVQENSFIITDIWKKVNQAVNEMRENKLIWKE